MKSRSLSQFACANKFLVRNLTEAFDQFKYNWGLFSFYKIHKQKLAAIKERTSPNYKPQRKDKRNCSRGFSYREAQRQLDILNANRTLYKKLVAIQTKNKKSKSAFKSNQLNTMHSHFSRAVKERITEENKRMLSKLVSSVATISKKKHETDYNANFSRLKKLKKIKDTNYKFL